MFNFYLARFLLVLRNLKCFTTRKIGCIRGRNFYCKKKSGRCVFVGLVFLQNSPLIIATIIEDIYIAADWHTVSMSYSSPDSGELLVKDSGTFALSLDFKVSSLLLKHESIHNLFTEQIFLSSQAYVHGAIAWWHKFISLHRKSLRNLTTHTIAITESFPDDT